MAGGEPAAVRELYARHGPALFSYLWSRLGSRRSAEEVVQDVMLAAWKAAPDFRGESTVRTWLFAIAHRRAVNAGRRRSLAAPAPEPDEFPEPDSATGIERALDIVDLRAAIDSLPPEQRTTLELVFAHGLSLNDVADATGVAPGTVKSRLHRAKRALRRFLEEGPTNG